jgi:3-deoxy-D-manno-octulosonate 8-phosphate phosphatase (KDO 8-P phosphatase)
MNDIQQLFENQGGEFVISAGALADKARAIRAFLFDWDGVFNSGAKGQGASSPFAEPDAAGTNYLRYGLFCLHGQMPFTGIVTGEHNPSAFQLAQREHFDAVAFRFADKGAVLQLLGEQYGIGPAQVAFMFDDVLDLPLAKRCGLRFLVRRPASPLLARYVRAQGLCDYVTGQGGHAHAVREVCELFLGLTGVFDQLVDDRVAYAPRYADFVARKKQVVPRYFTHEQGSVVEKEGPPPFGQAN